MYIDRPHKSSTITFLFFVLVLITINLFKDLSFIGKDIYEANKFQYTVSFILMNVAFVMGMVHLKKRVTSILPWAAALVFCMYAYWDPDFFSFGLSFKEGFYGYRDILYPYLSYVSFNSYILLRILIWGTAMFLFYKTLLQFKIKPNVGVYVFMFFFLALFSYARASLGMAFYFYGLSLFLNRKKDVEYISLFLKIALLFACAFFAHRSMLILIVLTPVIFLKLNRFGIFFVFILLPIATIYFKPFLDSFIYGGTSGSEFMNSAQKYSEMNAEVVYNWKYSLIIYLRAASFYIAFLYMIWRFFIKRKYRSIPSNIRSLFTYILAVIFVATVFFIEMGTKGFGLYIVGYRILFMAGLPVCIIISYLYQRGLIKLTTLNVLLIPSIFYSEFFIIGKILSDNVM